jgi:uncharacterized protein (DUF488 family)
MHELLTIGHSDHAWDPFIEMLRLHGIKAVADVRSSPFSARHPQFNRDHLESGLRSAGIWYVFLGKELGARRSERECYVNGVARYDRIAQTPAFRAGLDRLKSGIQRCRIVLMCAERDPLECHRTILVCRHLRAVAQIAHIFADGTLESHTGAEGRLMAEEHVPDNDLFSPREQLLGRAYDQRGEKIAYHESTEPVSTA